MTTIFIGDKPIHCEVDLSGNVGSLDHVWQYARRECQGCILQYEDDEGDVVTVSSNAELREAIQLYKQLGKKLTLEISGDVYANEPGTPCSVIDAPIDSSTPSAVHRSISDSSFGDDYELCASAVLTEASVLLNTEEAMEESEVVAQRIFALPELPWMQQVRQPASPFEDLFAQRLRAHRQLFDEQHGRLVQELETQLVQLQAVFQTKWTDKKGDDTRFHEDYARQAQALYDKFQANEWLLKDRCSRFLSQIPTCTFLAPVSLNVYLVRRVAIPPCNNKYASKLTPVRNATSMFTLQITLNCTDAVADVRPFVRQRLIEQGFTRAAEAVSRSRILLFKQTKHQVDPDSKKSTWQRLINSNKDERPVYEMRPERLIYDDEHVRVGDLHLTPRSYVTLEGPFDEKMFVRTRRGDSINEVPAHALPAAVSSLAVSSSAAPLPVLNQSPGTSCSAPAALSPISPGDAPAAVGAATSSPAATLPLSISLPACEIKRSAVVPTPQSGKMPLSALGATSPLANQAAAVPLPHINTTPAPVPQVDNSKSVLEQEKKTKLPACIPLCAATHAVSFPSLPCPSSSTSSASVVSKPSGNGTGTANNQATTSNNAAVESKEKEQAKKLPTPPLNQPPLSSVEQHRLDNLLAAAVADRDVVRTRKAVEQGANINCVLVGGYGWSPLQKAAHTGSLSLVAFLLSRPDVRINAQDMYGWTALMRAAKGNHLPVVRLLLAKKADVTLKNEMGKTALQIARDSYFQRVVDLLEGRVNLYPKTPANNASAAGEPSADSSEDDLVLLEGDELAESRVQGAFEVNGKRKRRNSFHLRKSKNVTEEQLSIGDSGAAERIRAVSAPDQLLQPSAKADASLQMTVVPASMEDSVELP